MGRIIKVFAGLAVLGLAGLSAYAYLGNLAPTQSQVTQPVTLDAN